MMSDMMSTMSNAMGCREVDDEQMLMKRGVSDHELVLDDVQIQ